MMKKQINHSKGEIEDCFKVMRIEGREQQLFVPACVQLKIKNFTDVDFDNLKAKVNGVLCINFLIFTQNQYLRDFLCDRLYFNPEEQRMLTINRKKKMQRQACNYVPIIFNKDTHVKLPTTRTKEFQIQSFKSGIKYRKDGALVEGIRIFHIVRKEFNIEIKKNGLVQNFFAPFDFINLQMVVALEHMDVGPFHYKDRDLAAHEQDYMKQEGLDKVKYISFNLLRIQQPYTVKNLSKEKRIQLMAPIIAYSSEDCFGKYDVVETQLEGYTHDERQIKQCEDESLVGRYFFEDAEPTQLNFKPFKYAVFKIPLFRYPVVDMMTVFVPLWLLSFVSIYIYFQTTEIMMRIVNVAALMIAYAAIQPIVRENLPEATTITLVDLLIYAELFINFLFLARTITIRNLIDNPEDADIPQDQTNAGYDRWDDGLFIASLIISITNVAIVAILIIVYFINRRSYKAEPLPRSVFSISNSQNWTLKLLMERSFARYRETLMFIE